MSAADGPPVDFYASAIAAFVVIVFTKFAAHNHPREHSERNRLANCMLGECAHVVCVVTSVLGVILALAVLAEWTSLFEPSARFIVAGLLLVAIIILTFDTATPRPPRAR
jgi:magnesium-transporting ATPase (P-type)